jgi:hypothetical protein
MIATLACSACSCHAHNKLGNNTLPVEVQCVVMRQLFSAPEWIPLHMFVRAGHWLQRKLEMTHKGAS